jgi:hypothetical protein
MKMPNMYERGKCLSSITHELDLPLSTMDMTLRDSARTNHVKGSEPSKSRAIMKSAILVLSLRWKLLTPRMDNPKVCAAKPSNDNSSKG